ncbi:DUF2501 domain-containing protein [Paraburkholderia caballeronis]|uniref:DUF2501 domain-containing protein n=1 Tax=Paraburkholderia caballeronis TaxID=416943 RepID=A0A1H7S0C3_9BURK|nr:DUF2501 domain-containing protein [Paraburkholderia caballeronis]PXW22818.1 uncharacterized protein DUF2501 [Paraburkholderia caballeronis]PXW97203.1 uncharacterized protein DUF2501 [Paraburkholderia caballeronis]RAJ93723.1 uncharacterized protein DUF2501 [Paraburkholderia caballeronis]SED61958.1 Protein of unknown function [Paraburkholderia caballeronis]SEL65915.1 Protein of unknown function [Paraburkholderia caballeronis]
MQTSAPRIAALLVALALPYGVAHAQLGNLLNQGGGSSNSGGGALGNLGSLGGALSGQSVTSNSLGNVTGVLQYCIQNNYLSGNNASSVKDSLLGKLPGGASTSDSGFTQGAGGILTAGNGSKLDLSGGGLKAEATKQVCNQILGQAKSML